MNVTKYVAVTKKLNLIKEFVVKENVLSGILRIYVMVRRECYLKNWTHAYVPQAHVVLAEEGGRRLGRGPIYSNNAKVTDRIGA